MNDTLQPEQFDPDSTASVESDSNGPGDAAGQAAGLAVREAEFRQEREKWELQKQQEINRLRQEGELLSEAWQRLEEEVRGLLAERELSRRRATNLTDSGISPAATPVLSQPSPRKQPEAAWQHFQQLRRQTHKHNRPQA